MPCSHVIVACTYAHQDALLLVSPIYKAETLFNIYNNDFPVVVKPYYWHAYEGEIFWHNDQMRRNKKDRPKRKRITTEMDSLDKLERKRGLSRQVRHSRKNCQTRATSSTT